LPQTNSLPFSCLCIAQQLKVKEKIIPDISAK
jgi:hypothetical protein